jgi:hypothetical protein
MPQQYVVKQIIRYIDPETEDISITVRIRVDSGTDATITFMAPEGWATMSQQEKIAYGRAQIETHLEAHQYFPGAQREWPEPGTSVRAQLDIENMPGWASWTAQEVADWIEDNVHDSKTTKQTLTKMGQMLVHLRDIIIAMNMPQN